MEIKIEQKKGIFRTAIENFRNFAKLFGEDNIENMEYSIEDIAKASGYDQKQIEVLNESLESIDAVAAQIDTADYRLDDEDEEEIYKKKKVPFWKKSKEDNGEKFTSSPELEQTENVDNPSNTEYSEDAQALLNRVNKPKSKGEER